jgi:hypothetical protein
MSTPPEKPASLATPDTAETPASVESPVSAASEARLSGAYRRIQRLAIVLSAVAIIAAFLLSNWRSGLGAAIGSALAFVNFIWLHRGAETMVERMLAPDESVSSRLRIMFHFPGRYLAVIGVAYVILKSYPGMLIGFIVGLVLPVLAAMGEGIYEAVVVNRIDQTHD